MTKPTELTDTPKAEGDALNGMPRITVVRAISRARAELTKAEHTRAAIKSRGAFYRMADRQVRMKRAVLNVLLQFSAEVDAGYDG